MRFQYSTNSPDQNEFDSLPRLSLLLHRETQSVEATGLVDSGATVNVSPYELGFQLGGIWDNRRAIIQLAGNLSSQLAMPFSATVEISDLTPTELVLFCMGTQFKRTADSRPN